MTDIVEGANVKGVTFVTKVLDSRLKYDNNYHNEKSKSRDYADMLDDNSMLQLDTPIRTLGWKTIIDIYAFPYGTPQWLIKIESPKKRAKFSTCVDGNHQLSRTKYH
jgi:hypothetical protein